MVSESKAIVAALVIFAAGVVTGGLTVKVAGKKDGHKGEKGEKRLKASLTALNPTNNFPVADNVSLPAQAGNPVKGNIVRRPELQMQALMRRMEYELNLRPEQRKKVEVIMHDSEEQMRRIWEEFPAQFQSLRQKIRAELDPDQRTRFEEIFRQKEEWRRPPQQQRRNNPGQQRGNQPPPI